jgi:hypothetical protein
LNIDIETDDLGEAFPIVDGNGDGGGAELVDSRCDRERAVRTRTAEDQAAVGDEIGIG